MIFDTHVRTAAVGPTKFYYKYKVKDYMAS